MVSVTRSPFESSTSIPDRCNAVSTAWWFCDRNELSCTFVTIPSVVSRRCFRVVITVLLVINVELSQLEIEGENMLWNALVRDILPSYIRNDWPETVWLRQHNTVRYLSVNKRREALVECGSANVSVIATLPNLTWHSFDNTEVMNCTYFSILHERIDQLIGYVVLVHLCNQPFCWCLQLALQYNAETIDYFVSWQIAWMYNFDSLCGCHLCWLFTGT